MIELSSELYRQSSYADMPLRELVAIARSGLGRLAREGRDERSFLGPLEDRLERGKSPGEEVLELWQGEWGGSPDRLIEYARY